MNATVKRIGEKIIIGVAVSVISNTILKGVVYPYLEEKRKELQKEAQNKKKNTK